MKIRRLAGVLGWRGALLPLVLALPTALFAGSSSYSKETIEQARAVAHVRVTKLAEELREEKLFQIVTFTLCGAESGLGNAKEVSVLFLVSDTDRKAFENTIGERYVVLFAPKKGGWQAVGWFCLSNEGKLGEDEAGREAGLKPGTEADAVVQLLAVKLKKDSPVETARPKPPTARNQPWNLMRASPLRRVWPFFPR
jgi:hypothetical protein